MDKDQLVYSITLEWMYNVIKGNHEKAHDVICKMAGKDPEVIHNIFCIASFTFSNLVGVVKSLSEKNQDVINELCEAMISEESPKDVLEQFMCEEDYNNPDDFKRPPEYTGITYDRDFTEEDLRKAIDRVKTSLDKFGTSVPQQRVSPNDDPPKSKQNLNDERIPIKLKFIGVEFDYDKVNLGEKKVNDALGKGFEIVRTINTESGLVIVMGLYQNRGAK